MALLKATLLPAFLLLTLASISSPQLTGCNAPQCIECASTLYNNCGECAVGYSLRTSDRNCIQCISNCKTCSTTTSCTTCNDGYYDEYNPVNYQYECKPCSSTCKTCTSASSCDSCKSGYFLIGYSCEKCMDYCAECTSKSSCTQCIERSKYDSWNDICSKPKDGFVGTSRLIVILVWVFFSVLTIGCIVYKRNLYNGEKARRESEFRSI